MIAAVALLVAPTLALAVAPFTVRDIRVEGLQRVEPGTVFASMPLRVGETYTDEKAAAAIRALFALGLFKDVRIEVQNDVVVVIVEERPTIANVDFAGIREFDKEALLKSLRDVGLAEGRAFDKSLADRAEQELKRQYISRSLYGAEVVTTVTPAERNRVNLTFTVTEGEPAKIKDIRIVGNKAFSEKELRKQLQSSTTGWFSFFTKDDQYSRQKLAADIESLRSFYLDRGYLKFNVESTQVSITPDKQDVYITINVTEGEPYLIEDVQLTGEFGVVPEQDLRQLVTIRPGETFSRARMTEIAKKISERLGEEGYALANINTVPQVDEANRKVALTFVVEPGRRVYVRRVNFQGNVKTQDEVLRRELRQAEGAWLSTKDLDRSKTRLQRLEYLESVNVETPAVPGAQDQVDVNYTVVERPSGSLLFGLGYGQESGILFNASVTQNNFLGTGNQLGVSFNNSDIGQNYNLSFNNPYYTLDGVSLGFRLYYRDIDSSELNAANYVQNVYGGQINFGFPLNEFDTLRLSPGYEHVWIDTTAETPVEIFDFIRRNGDSFDEFKLDASWARDSRDRTIFPTSGSLNQITAEIALPGSTAEFYKLNYRSVVYFPLGRWLTWTVGGEVGYGDGYGNTDGLPFFENLYAGGLRSVRGYKANTLGPRYSDDEPSGGAFKTVASTQLILPVPFVERSENVRVATFFDIGNVFSTVDEFDVGELRYSVGLAGQWLSPFGPIVLSVAAPLNEQSEDETEFFQFSFGVPFN